MSWIDVKDRLPPLYEPVLAWCDAPATPHYQSVVRRIEFGERYYWECPVSDEAEVYYWQPLPPEPEEADA